MRTLWLTISMTAVLLFSTAPASADVVILVHGYLGTADSWQNSGVTTALEQQGWQPNPRTVKEKAFYVVNLPSEASIDIQATYLHRFLQQLRQAYPDDRMVLVGHSAGGVVSRLVMVKHPTLKIYGLISIATPHLGTAKAEDALFVSRTPLSWMTPMVGAGTLNRSRGLYQDLVREKPGSLLGWLNQQPHPDAEYVSIIRSNASGQGADNIVPLYSQDMRNVKALKGKAKSYRLDVEHTLSKPDGQAITGVLFEMLTAQG